MDSLLFGIRLDSILLDASHAACAHRELRELLSAAWTTAHGKKERSQIVIAVSYAETNLLYTIGVEHRQPWNRQDGSQ